MLDISAVFPEMSEKVVFGEDEVWEHVSQQYSIPWIQPCEAIHENLHR